MGECHFLRLDIEPKPAVITSAELALFQGTCTPGGVQEDAVVLASIGEKPGVVHLAGRAIRILRLAIDGLHLDFLSGSDAIE